MTKIAAKVGGEPRSSSLCFDRRLPVHFGAHPIRVRTLIVAVVSTVKLGPEKLTKEREMAETQTFKQP